MALIDRLDHNGTLRDEYRNTLRSLARKLTAGRCLLFLGAGASIDDEQPDLPTANELSDSLLKECELEWPESVPLSQSAFYYESMFDRDDLNQKLVEIINNKNINPSKSIVRLMDIIELLEQRKIETIAVTTNYDQHFETAYEVKFSGRKPAVIIYRGGRNPQEANVNLNVSLDPSAPEIDPVSWHPDCLTTLYKIHGCISQPEQHGLVITEEDYINFLMNALASPDSRKKILGRVKALMEQSTILFVGYSLSDWNFRAIFKATAESRVNNDYKSYAVQRRDPRKAGTKTDEAFWKAMSDFWAKKNVQILNAQASDFMKDLFDAMPKTREAAA